MRNQQAAVARRLSDPDFQGTLVSRSLTLNMALAVALCVSLIHDAWVWTHPAPPRFFFVDGKHAPRPVVALDSPIVDDTELLNWTVKAVLAPYNIDYYNYPQELGAASRRFTVRGWNTFAQSFITQGNFGAETRASAVPCAGAACGGDPPDQLCARRVGLPDSVSPDADLRERQPDQQQHSRRNGARRSHERR
jgi:intracellular multiplication protein IcmL